VCLQDLAMGFATDVGESSVNILSVSSTPVIGGNPKRTMLYFTPPVSGNVWLSTNNAAAVGLGLHLHSSLPGVLLTIQQYGQLVQKGWSGINDTAPSLIGIFEGFMDPDKLAHFMQQLKAGY
jgi:hypothetical protein